MSRASSRASEGPVTIGEAARLTGVSAKMIRYYEGIALIGAAERSSGGYRLYGAADLNALRFVRRGRDLGFSMTEIADLLSLWRDRSRASADVKALALSHVADLRRRITELDRMAHTLADLAERCGGDERSDCPILDELAAMPAAEDQGTASTKRTGARPELKLDL